MKQLLRSIYNRLTYRNEYTDPDRADGLWVSEHGYGKRTVHHPGVRGYLHARQVRLVRDGCDVVDLMLLDDDTAAGTALPNSLCVRCHVRDIRTAAGLCRPCDASGGLARGPGWDQMQPPSTTPCNCWRTPPLPQPSPTGTRAAGAAR